MRVLVMIVLVSLLAAGCGATDVATVPPIIVNITAVDDTQALSDGIAQALTGTAQVQIHATETVLAQGGVTLTPSSTPTQTPTQRPQPTLAQIPTITLTPTSSATPTYEAYPPGTLAPVENGIPGWIRVVHAWPGTTTTTSPNYDVYINDEIITRSLSRGQQTNYLQVMPGAVRISLRQTGENDGLAETNPLVISTVIEVKAGINTSALIVAGRSGVELVTIEEEAAPLPVGKSRVTIYQADPGLFPINILIPNLQKALVYDLQPSQVIGPVELPSGDNYLLDLYDVTNPDALLTTMPPISLVSRVSYLLVFMPPTAEDQLTSMALFSSSTRAVAGDVHARFINLAQNIGQLQISINNQSQFTALPIGVSEAIPLSTLGSKIEVRSQDNKLIGESILPAWTKDTDKNDKLILFYDNPDANGSAVTAGSVRMSIIAQNPPQTAINAQLRLIHGLPGFTPFELQVRPLRSETVVNAFGTPETRTQGEDQFPWVTVGRSEFGQASSYAARTPELVEVRAVLSGTRDVIAQMGRVQLQAGNSYDFLVLPDADPGTTRMVLLQPRAQNLSAAPGNPEAINEAVAATLTALAPVITATPTRISSPTPTRTPIPTNTPRPTNTPSFTPPSLAVDPAPPDTVRENVVIFGEHFPPLRQYSVFLDNQLDQLIQTGTTGPDGAFAAVVNLPFNLSAGVHVVRVCVGTCPGRGTEALAPINVAPPGLTPTASPQP